MATKIRLQRFGKKGKPFYHVVVADARAPRDGKFIERIGSYNPNTNPATIDLNFDKALDWVNKGAQPTDTCRAILSYKGVMYKKHLEGGVKKGALTAEQADTKFSEWLESKEGKIAGKKDTLTKSKDEVKKAALAAEAKKKEEVANACQKVVHLDTIEKVFKVLETLVCADLQRRIHDNLSKKSLITSSFQMTTNNSSKRLRGYQKTQYHGYQGECNSTK